jgi:hypothetical protein
LFGILVEGKGGIGRSLNAEELGRAGSGVDFSEMDEDSFFLVRDLVSGERHGIVEDGSEDGVRNDKVRLGSYSKVWNKDRVGRVRQKLGDVGRDGVRVIDEVESGEGIARVGMNFSDARQPTAFEPSEQIRDVLIPSSLQRLLPSSQIALDSFPPDIFDPSSTDEPIRLSCLILWSGETNLLGAREVEENGRLEAGSELKDLEAMFLGGEMGNGLEFVDGREQRAEDRFVEVERDR